MQKHIVLASASPRRRQILEQLNLEFDILQSHIIEEGIEANSPEQLAVKLAENKAISVAKKVTDSIVIGADTVVLTDNRILGKPKNEIEAEQMLLSLAGRTHEVITGVAVVETGRNRIESDYEKTLVTMRSLDILKIRSYIKTGESMDKAGAYAIQGYGSLLVTKIEGCYFNVVGLPVVKLSQLLGRFDFHIL